jgi:cell division protein FtsI/penicillin-binding protein 2
MFQALQYRRLAWLGLVLLLAFACLEWRLYLLHVVRHGELEGKARSYYEFKRGTPAIRGEIRDANDVPLAMVRPVKNIFVDPCLLGEQSNEMARLLACWLQTDACVLERTKLRPRLLGADGHGRKVYDNKVCLKQGASVEEWERLQRKLREDDFGFDPARLRTPQKVQLQRLRNHAVYAEDDHGRTYPQDRLLCHVVGRVDHDFGAGVFVPEWGIEKVFNAQLEGTAGCCEGVRDVRGRELPDRRAVFHKPVDGNNVVLTIDLGLQEIATKELRAGLDLYGAQGAVAIIVRVRTGEVQALVSLPDYGLGGGPMPADAWRDRVIQDLIEPGSTFKMVTYAAALNEGLIDWNELIDCKDGLKVGRPLSDSEPMGVVPLLEAFAKSSNKAAAQVGLRVGGERLNRYIRAFGFCEPTGLGLEGERYAPASPVKPGSLTSVTRASIGYGVAVTPLQLVMAMSALANEGRLMKPLLVARIVDNQGKVVAQAQPCCVRAVVSPAAARAMAVGLKAVVSKDGTGRLAMMEDFTLAGKTGTARVAGKHGYEAGKYRGTFVGFFPADAPELCILVMYDQPSSGYYGGLTAAPVCRAIAEQAAGYLRLPPGVKRLGALAQKAPAATLASGSGL